MDDRALDARGRPCDDTIIVQHGAGGDASTYFGIWAWHVTSERIET